MGATQVVKTSTGTGMLINGVLVDAASATTGQALVFNGTSFVPSGVTSQNVKIITTASAADVGAAINAADAALGSNVGVIQVQDGNYTLATQVHLHSNHKLQFGIGTITPTTAGFAIVYDSNVEICGSGWGTILKEPSTSVHTVITGYINSSVDGSADGETNVWMHDFQVQGPYASTFDSAAAAIGVGNAHNVAIERVWINKTKAIGLNIGGASGSAFFAENVWIRDCLFTGTASQMVGIVNAKAFHVVGCTFRDGGQTGSGTVCTMLDVEENLNTCWAGPFEIVGNLFDGTNSQTAGNAIDVTGSGTPGAWPEQTGPGVISGNTIQAATSDLSSFPITIGIALTNAHGILVVGNKIKRTGQSGITVNSTYQSSIIGNSMVNCGGGGIPGFTMTDSLHNFISGNAYHVDVSANAGGSYSSFQEAGACDYNVFTNNFIDINADPPSGDFVHLVGTHSYAYNTSIRGRSVNHSATYDPVSSNITTSRALAQSDGTALVDTTGGAVTLTLPDATDAAATTNTGTTGRRVQIKRVAGSSSITVATVSAQTIDGASSLTISDGFAVTLQSNGANWVTLKSSNIQTQAVTATATTTITPQHGNSVVKLNLQSATNVTSLTVSAGQDGEEMVVWITQPGAGTPATVPTTWTNVSFAGGTFTNTATLAKRDSVRLRYDSTTSKWYEVSRALNLSN